MHQRRKNQILGVGLVLLMVGYTFEIWSFRPSISFFSCRPPDRRDCAGAELHETNLNGTDLSGANFRNAILTGAHLQGANLQGADLSKTNLVCADLTNANLEGANLNSTNFRNADLNGAKIGSAYLGLGWFDDMWLVRSDGTLYAKNYRPYYWLACRSGSSKGGYCPGPNCGSASWHGDKWPTQTGPSESVGELGDSEDFWGDSSENYYGDSNSVCIGDCNDMDGDGRTFDDVDGDGDGLYETP